MLSKCISKRMPSLSLWEHELEQTSKRTTTITTLYIGNKYLK